MHIVGEVIVHRNRFPATRPESYSGTTVCRVRDPDGSDRLLIAFRSGSARMSTDGRIVTFASHDDGATWGPIPNPLTGDPSWPAAVHPDGTPSLAGSQMGASSDGTVLLSAARMWLADPGGPGWDDDAAGLLDADAVIVRGRSGSGWEPPVILDGRRHPGEWAIPCGPPLALGGGSWLWPLERHAKADQPEWLRGYHAFAALSEDDGQSWPVLVEMPNDPERRIAHYDQRCTIAADGRIVALAWAHDVVGDRTLPARVSVSADGGRSWSTPSETGIIGGPVNPVTLPDGRILGVYARRTAPRGVRCSLSEDGGRTWRTDRELVIFDEASGRIVGERASVVDRHEADPPLWGTMWGWTFGQPMPVVLPGGEVGVAFFAQGPDRMPSVRFVRMAIGDG